MILSKITNQLKCALIDILFVILSWDTKGEKNISRKKIEVYTY